MSIFKELHRNGILLGYYHREQNDLIFFGTKHLDREGLGKLFPDLKFRELKQVHGKEILHTRETSPNDLVADGHWTDESHIALLIKTADCVPMMVHATHGVAALHAGWRGIEAQIGPRLKNIAAFKNAPLKIFLGPHIDADHFEVGEDVAEKLLAADPRHDKTAIKTHREAGKKWVDLALILENQMNEKVFSLHQDTFSNPDHFWSYRRKAGTHGRLYSFIARLTPGDFTNLKL